MDEDDGKVILLRRSHDEIPCQCPNPKAKKLHKISMTGLNPNHNPTNLTTINKPINIHNINQSIWQVISIDGAISILPSPETEISLWWKKWLMLIFRKMSTSYGIFKNETVHLRLLTCDRCKRSQTYIGTIDNPNWFRLAVWKSTKSRYFNCHGKLIAISVGNMLLTSNLRLHCRLQRRPLQWRNNAFGKKNWTKFVYGRARQWWRVTHIVMCN